MTESKTSSFMHLASPHAKCPSPSFPESHYSSYTYMNTTKKNKNKNDTSSVFSSRPPLSLTNNLYLLNRQNNTKFNPLSLPATSTTLIRQCQPYSLSNYISSSDKHPVEQAIPMHIRKKILHIADSTSTNPDAPISSFDNTVIHQITHQSFQNLVRHGSPIDDSIIHSYLCFLLDTF